MILKSIFLTLFLALTMSVAAQVKKPSANPKPKTTSSPEIKKPPTVIGEVTTKDGKKVVLKSDNTWEYVQVPTDVAQTKEPEENKYLKIPLNADAARLPRGFMGQDFLWLHGILRKDGSFKSEFETTEDYDKKVAAKEAFHLTSQFAVFPYGGVPSYKREYNADSKQFSVSVNFEDKALFYYQSSYKPVFDFHSAFTSGVIGSSGIVVTNPNRFSAPFSFTVDAEHAKTIKENSKLLVLFHLQPPYSYDINDREVSGGKTIRILIVGEINDIWLVNQSTGEIYAKLMK